MAKPKKALRGLFARTEPTVAEDVTSHRSIKKALGIRETPVVEASDEDVTSHLPVVEESLLTEAVSAEPEITVENSVTAPASLEPSDELVSEAVSIESMDALVQEVPASDATTIEASCAETVVEVAVEVAMEVAVAMPAQQVSTPEVHNANVAAAVANIQYNFNLSREDREAWAEKEYIECIRRIDVAQAEAFFLKGKLLGEVKDRFYQENKTGWKGFAEGSLGMNYTTVNQYIRVATEFDVASHRRPDFGFEHYKALLPLNADDRTRLLDELPQVSVKELRNIVQRKLLEDGVPVQRSQRTLRGKELIELLISLQTKIFDCTPEAMDQKERWQLTAACRDLAEDLNAVAVHLNGFGKRSSETTTEASL